MIALRNDVSIKIIGIVQRLQTLGQYNALTILETDGVSVVRLPSKLEWMLQEAFPLNELLNTNVVYREDAYEAQLEIRNGPNAGTYTTVPK